MQIKQALDEVLDAIENKKEKNLFNIYQDLNALRMPGNFPVSISRQADPADPPAPKPKTRDEKLAVKIQNILKPLALENPFSPAVSVDTEQGTGFMPAAFGIDIAAGAYPGGVTKHIPVSQTESMGFPPPESDPRFSEMKEQIHFCIDNTPPEIKISIPDLQGPFNIAYSIAGSDIFLAMHDTPAEVHKLMEKTSGYFIQCFSFFQKHLPAQRWVPHLKASKRIAECAVNLISKDLYKEFVAPYDRKIVDFWGGEVAIHTCSGPHVFEATMEEFGKEIKRTECGVIPNASAGYLTVDEALKQIKGRNIILGVGEELVSGKEEEIIKNHLLLLKQHPLMLFSYCGMYWKKKDDAFIITLRKNLEDFFYREIAPPAS